MIHFETIGFIFFVTNLLYIRYKPDIAAQRILKFKSLDHWMRRGGRFLTIYTLILINEQG